MILYCQLNIINQGLTAIPWAIEPVTCIASACNFKPSAPITLRIVSKGQSSPEGFWYDQDENEWLILLRGSAGLLFEGNDNIIELKPGDYINISANRKHRVEWTDGTTETVWIAVMY